MAVLSGFGLAHHHTAHRHAHRRCGRPHGARTAATPRHAPPPAPPPAADPALAWLASAGGQAQVTFNNEVSTLAADLETENGSPTVANHLIFEADARAVRAQAQKILTTPALLPAVNRPAYQHMLNDYIVVASLLQPGPGYGTTPQDYAAWNAAMNASNINVS